MNDPQGELGEAHSKGGPAPRRVLHLLGPSSGGIRRHVRYLALNPPAGYETAGVSGPPGLAGYFDGVPFHPAGRRPPPGSRADLLHAHGLTAAAKALRWTGLATKGPPFAVTVHTSMRQTLRASFPGATTPAVQTGLWAAARTMLRRAAAVIAVSETVRDELGFGVVVAPAIDLPEAQPDARRRVRKELETPEERLVILAVGRLHRDKRLDTFVRALRDTDAEGWIAGEGPERAALESLAQGTGVRLLGHRSDIGDLLAAADVFALPAMAESYGFAVMEAVAAGLPVVATRTGAVPELVGDAGILVDPGNEEHFRAAVHSLTSSPELRKTLREAARGRALPSAGQLAARVGEVYDQVLG
ncbi:MAG TPA: glycosyltransferase family 4 protein [Actinomycetota bacterium]|nr:glycosyltransferase family 4 protein [Actinomycetota bacterium]